MLADSLFNSFNFDQALELLNQAVQMDPSSIAFTKRGDAHLRLNQLDLALKDFDQAITADRKNPLALYFRGMVLMRQRKPEEATQDFEQVITVDGGCGFGHLGLGIIRAVNNKSQAIESLSRADELLSIQLAEDPDNSWLLLHRAQACRFLALLTPSSSVFAWFGVRTRGKLLEKAAADLDRTLMLKPSFLEAIIERGLVRVAAGRFEPGYHDLKSAIAIVPASTFRLGANEIIVRGSNHLSTIERDIVNFELQEMKDILPSGDSVQVSISSLIELLRSVVYHSLGTDFSAFPLSTILCTDYVLRYRCFTTRAGPAATSSPSGRAASSNCSREEPDARYGDSA